MNLRWAETRHPAAVEKICLNGTFYLARLLSASISSFCSRFGKFAFLNVSEWFIPISSSRETGGGGLPGAMPVVTGAKGFMRMNFSRPGLPRGLVLAALLFAPQAAKSMAVDGTLMYNAVSATYHGVSGIGAPYSVTYNATAQIVVSCPVISLRKYSNITVQNVGGAVTFFLCALNDSSQASAFNVTLRDRMPANVAWLGDYGTWGAAFSQELYSTDGVTYSGDLVGSPPTAGASPLWFYWALTIGPERSACIQYAVTVQ